MKKILLPIFVGILSMAYISCGEEEAYSLNPVFDEEATGDTKVNPNIINGGVIDTSSVDSTGNGGGNNNGGLPAGFLADTVASNRVAVLEDFTGVRCGFCPDGHEVAARIETNLGDDFIVIAVHASGSFSQPAPGTDWPNYETPFGDAIKNQADPSGFPAGSLNRLPASEVGATAQRTGGMAMGRGSWESASNSVITQSSPVNVGAKATLSGTTLTVKVDLFYTDDEPNTNHINVALIQDNLIGRQSGGTPDPNNYNNSHVLRTLIAGSDPQWGDPITESTTKGSIVQKSYTYEVPADYNGTGLDGGGAVVNDDLKVVVFVTRGQADILNATEVDVE